MKQAFSLFELLIVIILISLLYSIFVPKLSFEQKQNTQITIMTLKSYLLNQTFEEELTFSCLEDNLECYVHADGKLLTSKTIKGLFKTIPDVYSYDKKMRRLRFSDLKFDTFEDFKVIFSLRFNKKGLHNEVVVETDNGVFVLSNITSNAKRFDYLNDVLEDMQLLENEVKNAF